MYRWVVTLATGCSYHPSALVADSPIDPDGPTVDTTDMQSTQTRVTAGLSGLWAFDENGGTQITDSSGLPPVNLTIADLSKVTWSPGSLQINAPVLINSGFARNRILEACAASDAVTLEAWVTPSNITQIGTVVLQPARIVSFAPMNGGNHHISLGQDAMLWVGEVRTTNLGVDVNGDPRITEGPIVGSPTHLVIEADATERKLYVNGTPMGDGLGGPIDWDPMRTMTLTGEPNGKNPWLGTFHLIAIYNRKLSAGEVMQNFLAGP